MGEETNSGIPQRMKSNINKRIFVLLCVCLSMVCAIIISAVIISGIGSAICGFVPVELVAFSCTIGHLVGAIFYVKKHKYAGGENYSWYQVINSAIYGIQNVLRILLVVALFNLFLIPVLAILIAIYGIIYIKKIFK